jgi:hypothetical protein
MNRFLIYLLIIFTYLGISKSFYPNKQVTVSIPNKYAISSMFKNAPLSIILTDMDEVGLIMKTYLMKYLLISGYQEPISVTIKTNKQFWEESKKFIGMSIFRRKEKGNEESTVPMPPGFHFIGDSSYGYWKIDRKTKVKNWFFYRSSSEIKKHFYYGKYRPTHEMIKKARLSLKKDKPFFGLKNGFGLDGNITRSNLPAKIFTKKSFSVDYKKHFLRFLDYSSF